MSDLPRRIGLARPAPGGARAAPGARELLAAAGPVRDGRRDRGGRPDPAGRRRRPAVPRPCRVRGHRRLRLRLGDVGVHADAGRCRAARGRRARARRRRSPRSSGSSSRRSPAASGASTSAWPPSAWSSWCGTCCSTSRAGPAGSPAARGAVHPRRLQLQQPRPRLPRRRRRGVPGPAPALVPVPRPHPAGRWLAANLRTSRTGRAWANVRDSETAAAAMGIAVARHKASAFVVSSGYAGLAGALLALAYGRLAARRLQPHRCRSTSWS